MLSFRGRAARLCDGSTRREFLRVGGLSALGLSLPGLLSGRTVTPSRSLGAGKAKSCIILFLMGGPPQHSTWDPKPDAPADIRGEFGPTDTNIPGVRVCSLLPRLARQADKLCLLRAVSTGDNAHSSSGYYMLTGVPHAPMNNENANPGPPNDWPNLGALVRRLRGDQGGLPAAVRLPMHIFNTDSSVWPGQDAGFLGRANDPWLFRCEPGGPELRAPEFSFAADVPARRVGERRDLLARLDQTASAGMADDFGRVRAKGFDLLNSERARGAFDLGREPAAVREQYGRSHFGQSCLLARRLVEAGVGLVQVNWFRGPDEPSDNPCWDSHTGESERLKTVLAPAADRAFAELIADLAQRGLLDETLVVCMAEFGRTPRFNGRAGRDHWGSVFSVALAGGGIRGGQVYGSSDRHGAYPSEGRVSPQDLTATVLHCLGYSPEAEIHDALGRPLPVSRGEVIRAIL
ncbi:MAG TPA: DUF1501 domain-containing protein [Planctomycetales bacterium]|jgi:hypothetical protein|nr:DUF1501 domain-containing protein [Planctomycetales bacterium]